MGKILDPNRAGTRIRLRRRERVEPLHPAEHFTCSLLVIIHGDHIDQGRRRSTPGIIPNSPESTTRFLRVTLPIPITPLPGQINAIVDPRVFQLGARIYF